MRSDRWCGSTICGGVTKLVWTVGASDLRTLWPRWVERRRYRGDLRRLLRLGAHLIADIGLEHRRAAEEAGKPFWRA